jgi:hypothetical protein
MHPLLSRLKHTQAIPRISCRPTDPSGWRLISRDANCRTGAEPLETRSRFGIPLATWLQTQRLRCKRRAGFLRAISRKCARAWRGCHGTEGRRDLFLRAPRSGRPLSSNVSIRNRSQQYCSNLLESMTSFALKPIRLRCEVAGLARSSRNSDVLRTCPACLRST